MLFKTTPADYPPNTRPHTPSAIPEMRIMAMPCEILLSPELTSHDSLYSPYKQQKNTLI